MNFNYQVIIEYLGTSFSGWQIQKNSKTIQGVVQIALSKTFNKKIKIIGAGRTDAGVHALGQSANFFLDKKYKPFTRNFKSLNLKGKIIQKNLTYTNLLYNEYLKNNFQIIEIHNRPESLLNLIQKKVKSKLIFIFHNNPQELRGSSSVKERMFIAENTDQVYFVSNWVQKKFFEGLPYKFRNNCDILIQPNDVRKNITKFKNKFRKRI